jgi:hypothetical protein
MIGVSMFVCLQPIATAHSDGAGCVFGMSFSVFGKRPLGLFLGDFARVTHGFVPFSGFGVTGNSYI